MNTAISMIALLAWQQPQDVRDVMNEGVAEFKAGRYEVAIKRFEQAVSLQPDNVNAHLYLGTALQQLYVPGARSGENLEALRRAESEFQRVLELDRTNVTALSSLTALAYKSAGGLAYEERARKIDEAIRWNEQVVMIDSKNKDGLYWAGVLRWSNFYPDYMTARRDDGLTPEMPGPIRNSNLRVDLVNRYGRSIEDGIRYLCHAIELDPMYADAMSYLNLLIRERADLRDTQDEYQRDIAEANQWVDRAVGTKKVQAALGTSPPSVSASAAPPPLPALPRIRVAERIQDLNLTHKVDPVCSALATDARVHGEVNFTVVIGQDGLPSNIQIISGHPLLVPAALDAIKARVYKPTLLNGAPAEVLTTATFNMNCAQQ